MDLWEISSTPLFMSIFWPIIRTLLSTLLRSDLPYNFETNDFPDAVYDFVVVGAGVGGSVVAGRLAQVGATVLVLEAGKSAPAESAPLILAGIATTIMTDASKIYQTVQGEKIVVGEAVGGGSTVNALQHVQGSREDYDGWKRLGNVGWGYDDVVPYFKVSETFSGRAHSGSENIHGSSGPIAVFERQYLDHIYNTLKKAGTELGLGEISLSAPRKIGIGRTILSGKNGIRWSMSEAYLRPYAEKNIFVRTQAQVTKLLIQDRKVHGVQYIYRGKVRTVMASKEVILSAGALSTPKILMLSGIGPEQHLRDLGIGVEVPLEGVGQNLQDHFAVYNLNWKLKNKKIIAAFYKDLTNVKGFLKTRRGRLTEPLAPVLSVFANVKDRKNAGWPDIAMPISLVPPNTLTCGLFATRPNKTGVLKLRSADYRSDPLIDIDMMDDPEDLKTLLGGVKLIFNFIRTKNVQQDFQPQLIKKPFENCRKNYESGTVEFWKCFIKENIESYWHPCGTCKMAPDEDPMGVVDSRLRLRNVKSLRIVDASIIPRIVTPNLQNTVVMIGEKAADLIKEDHGYPKLV